MKISVSILNAKDKKETIKILNNTDISYFHIDVMDGNFVKQISLPAEETLELSKISNKKLEKVVKIILLKLVLKIIFLLM